MYSLNLTNEDAEALKDILLELRSDVEYTLEVYKGYSKYTDKAEADLKVINKVLEALDND